VGLGENRVRTCDIFLIFKYCIFNINYQIRPGFSRSGAKLRKRRELPPAGKPVIKNEPLRAANSLSSAANPGRGPPVYAGPAFLPPKGRIFGSLSTGPGPHRLFHFSPGAPGRSGKISFFDPVLENNGQRFKNRAKMNKIGKI
jgi:hypothetical protein